MLKKKYITRMDKLFIVFLYAVEADRTRERMPYMRLATVEILTAGFLKTEVCNLFIRLATKLAACHMHGCHYIHVLHNRKTVTMTD